MGQVFASMQEVLGFGSWHCIKLVMVVGIGNPNTREVEARESQVSLCVGCQLKEALPRSLPAAPSGESGKPPSLSLLSSSPNPPDLFLLCSSPTCSGLPILSAPFPTNHANPPLQPSSTTFVSGTNSRRHTQETCWPLRPLHQVGNVHSSPYPPIPVPQS